MAQRNTKETRAFLRHQHDIGSRAWDGKCLMLQRKARNLPAVFPSALAAAQGTPEHDRVYRIDKLTSGMVGFCDDPHDSNPFGHVFFISNDDDDDPPVWSNDVRFLGGVDKVTLSFFKKHWGDSFQFGAKSLNGFQLLLPGDKSAPAKIKKRDMPKHLEKSIEHLEKAIENHKNNTAMVKALKADIKTIKSNYIKLKG